MGEKQPKGMPSPEQIASALQAFDVGSEVDKNGNPHPQADTLKTAALMAMEAALQAGVDNK